jgi:GNAT superfamily N-acetyltransferase
VKSALFAAGEFFAMEATQADLPRLQEFLEANPEYDLPVNGAPPAPSAAQDEFESRPPTDFRYDRCWLLHVDDAHGAMVAVASVVSNLFAPGVGHIGLFIVATRLYGSGAAHEIYAALERWIHESGAKWMRLGVVAGNARAERFWERLGYVEVRRRLAVPMGARVNDLRVMMKPLAGGTVPEYLALVARDRPETP